MGVQCDGGDWVSGQKDSQVSGSSNQGGNTEEDEFRRGRGFGFLHFESDLLEIHAVTCLVAAGDLGVFSR